jgi:Holliday junction resolvase RusA-like endonuclease
MESRKHIVSNSLNPGSGSHTPPGRKEGGTKEISFTVDGLPQGKERPRAAKGQARPYTPAKTKRYETRVRSAFLAAYLERNGKAFPASGSELGKAAVGAEITAYLPMPKTASMHRERLMNLGVLRPVRKPDADNIAKSVLDALNKYAYDDDSQVAELTVRKYFCRQGEERVEVRIRPLEGG